MRNFNNRRFKNILLLVLLIPITCFAYTLCDAILLPTAFSTGVILLIFCLFLTFFNIRKKLSFIPLLSAATWTQIHIYLGLFTCLLFLIHIQFKIPNGILESFLASIFVIVGLSGVVGLILTRVLPKKMTTSGETLVYENIPAFRQEIINQVEELIFQAEKNMKKGNLSEFYVNYGEPFIALKPPLFTGLLNSHFRYSQAKSHLHKQAKFIEEEEDLYYCNELKEWMDTKRNLDFQESCQQILKGWLFFHIPFSYSLIILSFVHAYYVFQYSNNF